MISSVSRPPVSSLDRLLRPGSVAVIGASEDRTRIGGRPLSYLLNGAFDGPVFAINPRRDTVQGVPAIARIEDVDGAVDLAIVAVPGPAVMGTLEACAKRGVGAAVVFSSGFAEMGDSGRAEQRRLRALARDSGMRILGPNCLGLYNAAIGLFATFSSTIELGTPRSGPVGVVSQSGAYGGHVAYLARQRGIEVGTLLTTGNECDVEMAEGIAWMAGHDEVRVIAAVAEGPRDGDSLIDALECARAARKPVVFLKMGRSAVGASAAQSHTDSLAGEDRVFDAVLAAHGAYRAIDTEELLDVAYAASFGKFPATRDVGLMSVSGGAGIQLADAAERYGLNVPPMPDATQQRLRARMPFASPVNPVDITAQVFNEPELLPLNLNAMLEEGHYPAIVSFFTYVAGTGSMGQQLLATMAEASARHPDHLLVQCLVAPPPVVARYQAAGCPCFEDPDRAVRAVAALARFESAFREAPPPSPSPAVTRLPEGPLDEAASIAALVEAGMPPPPATLACTVEQAQAAAQRYGGPVVMKICSPDIAHKSDMGGVLLGLSGQHAVVEAFHMLMARAREHMPAARVSGVLVSPQAPDGLDVILGVRRDPLFGPMIMVGLGGIFVEVLEDVRIAPAPVDAARAHAMLRSLRGAPLLDGARGTAALDVDALTEAIVALSRFAEACGASLASVDVNPLRVLPEGQGVRMLDALVVPAAPGGGGE